MKNLISFFDCFILCSLTPQQATWNRVYELGEANALTGFIKKALLASTGLGETILNVAPERSANEGLN